jgi:hypothetical protein
MKTNVTLRLDQVLIREARILAAEKNISTANLLTTVLEQIVRERKAAARQHQQEKRGREK